VPKFSEPLKAASRALADGNRDAAWDALYPALRYPTGVSMSDSELAESLGIAAEIGTGSFSNALVTALSAAHDTPTDIQALFGAGFRLNEANFPELAATALARANALAPNVPGLVNELASALQASGLFSDAYVALHASHQARQQDSTTRYLYAFNALMSGNVVAAQRGFAELGDPIDEATREQHEHLGRLLERQAAVAPATALDSRDLRGWHYVVTGGLVTHLSPLRFDQGMHGRYGTLHDHDALVHEGVIRTIAVLQAWGVRPQQLIYSDDRASEILAHVWNTRLGIPTKVFRAEDRDAPGLFLAYDLRHADDLFVDSFREYRPGQVLVSHASCWSEESDYTSDIATFQYHRNTAPWDSADEAGAAITEPAVVAQRILKYLNEPAEVANRIVSVAITPDAVPDLDQVGNLARAAGPPPSTGRRDRFVVGSPVKSSRAG